MEIYFCQKEHLVFIQSNYFNLIFSIMIHEFLSFSGFMSWHSSRPSDNKAFPHPGAGAQVNGTTSTVFQFG